MTRTPKTLDLDRIAVPAGVRLHHVARPLVRGGLDEHAERGCYEIALAEERRLHGELASMESFEEYLAPALSPSEYRIVYRVVALDETTGAPADAQPVLGCVNVWIDATSEAPTMSAVITVAEGVRRRGIGTALDETALHIAELEHRATVQGWSLVPYNAEAAQLTPPTGAGSVDATSPAVRFALARGYALEQVARMSRLELAGRDEDAKRWLAEAQAAAGDDYRVETWANGVPEERIATLCSAMERMATDVPAGDLDETPTAWSRERLRDYEERMARTGSSLLWSAAIHSPTGVVAGYSYLSVPNDPTRTVQQEDTLVIREHRGHRLGMLVKAAGLVELPKRRPDARIETYNAEENRFMLDTNEAVGFVPVASEACWQKRL